MSITGNISTGSHTLTPNKLLDLTKPVTISGVSVKGVSVNKSVLDIITQGREGDTNVPTSPNTSEQPEQQKRHPLDFSEEMKQKTIQEVLNDPKYARIKTQLENGYFKKNCPEQYEILMNTKL
jgi:hypothetical protein